MLLQSTYITVKSKRQLKSYAGVDLETYKILHKSLESTEDEKQKALSSRPDRLRQYGGGSKEALLTIDDKFFSSYTIIKPIQQWTLWRPNMR